MKKVLIVEDDLDAANVLEAYLKKDCFETMTASDGQRGLDLALRWKPDLILLDVMLPGLNGIDVLMALRRKSEIPVIMVTAIGDGQDKISALRFGADDYVVKPYNPGEVVARIHAVLRRAAGYRATSPLIEYGKVRIDTEAFRASVLGDDGQSRPLELTPTELMLLTQLLAHPHKAFSRQSLLEASLPESDALERVVDTHIYNLRKKLESAGQTGVLINVRGIGYRFSH
ncbi:response regulator (plasmid) [Erwinia sp. E602]|uniref:response regulator transcription factor n=1 Tax=Erwinia sp. E602 TaxID=2675378 RepID=UPI001BAE2ED4|nr:response regulator transcription factor [Erwinia sp. E602]QUG73703.1 response regulator [Erwinia sp. E602]